MRTILASRPASSRIGASSLREYERIAAAIDYLRRHANAQPALAAVAQRVHMSEFHFQRLFTRWAGVSPKRFLQYLTIEEAKNRLVRFNRLDDVADEVGLSGTGRLHDLFVTIEAMSPGEFKAAGMGLTIRYAMHESPFGACLLAATPRGVCCVHFLERGEQPPALLKAAWPRAELVYDVPGTAALAKRLFKPLASGSNEPISLLVKGSNFQLQVWRALLAVPPGRLVTYGELAKRIGHPDSPRAVGNAVAANPIAWLIPCHRVIRETGQFGNYRWGEARKVAMLGWEAARCEHAATADTARPVMS